MSRISYAKQLWSQNRGLSSQCVEHPLVQGLARGTLPDTVYTAYMAQDRLFVEAFARAYAAGVSRAPDRDTMRAFFDLLRGLFDELELHDGVAPGPPPHAAPATRAYTEFLLAVAFSGTLGDLLAAVTPCMKLYHEIGNKLEQTEVASKYQAWVNTYGSEKYGATVDTLEAMLEEVSKHTVEEAGNYTRALELELEFFNAVFPSES